MAEIQKHNNIVSHAVVQDKKITDSEDLVLIYNRVPKTGSTSFVGIVYDLCKPNKYHSLHINVTNNMHTLTLPNQVNDQKLHFCSIAIRNCYSFLATICK